MNIFVMSRLSIEKHFDEIPTPYVLISFRGKHDSKPNIHTTEYLKDICYIQCDDIESKWKNKDDETSPYMKDLINFTPDMAKEILEFVEKHKELFIICQCEAGISRSAGCAAALSKIYNGDDTKFFKEYCPNSLVYNMLLRTYYENI